MSTTLKNNEVPVCNKARPKKPTHSISKDATFNLVNMTFNMTVKFLRKELNRNFYNFLMSNGLKRRNFKSSSDDRIIHHDPINGTHTIVFNESFDAINTPKKDVRFTESAKYDTSFRFDNKNNPFIFKKCSFKFYFVERNKLESKLSFTFSLKDQDSDILDIKSEPKAAILEGISWLKDFHKSLTSNGRKIDDNGFPKLQPQMFPFDIISSQTSSDLDEIVSFFKEKIPSIEANGALIGGLITKLDNLVTTNVDIKEQAKESISKVFESGTGIVTNATLKVMSIIFFCATTTHLIVSSAEGRYKLFLVSMICLLIFAGKDMYGLITRALSTIRELTVTKPQSGLLTGVNMATSIAVLLLGGLFAIELKPNMIKDIMNVVGNFNKFKEGLVSIITWMSQLVVAAVDYTGYGSIVPISMRYLFVNNVEVKKFVEDVQEVVNEINKKKFIYSDTNYHRVNSMIETGKKIRLGLKESASISAITAELNMLTSLSNKMRESNYNLDGRRPEPIVLVLVGPPGHLKSQMVSHFITAIANRAFSEDAKFLKMFNSDTGRYVYPVAPENVYYDSYNNDKIFATFDDFGQCSDIAGNPDNEYMKMIRMVGEDPLICHMADLDKKGCTFFTSPFIIATTNREKLYVVPSLNDPSALWRRMHIPIYVTVKPEFQKKEDGPSSRPMLDGSKLPKDSNGTYFEPNHVVYESYNFEKADRTGFTYTFEDVVEKVVSGYRENIRRFEQKNKQLEITMKKFTPPIFMDELDALLEVDSSKVEDILAKEKFSLFDRVNQKVARKYDILCEKLKKAGDIEYNKLYYIQTYFNRLHNCAVSQRAIILLLIDSYAKEFSEFIRSFHVHKKFEEILMSISEESALMFETYVGFDSPLVTRCKDIWISCEDIMSRYVSPMFRIMKEYAVWWVSFGLLLLPIVTYLYATYGMKTRHYVSCLNEGCSMYAPGDPSVSPELEIVDVYKEGDVEYHTCGLIRDLWEVTEKHKRPDGKMPRTLLIRDFFNEVPKAQSNFMLHQRREQRARIRPQMGGVRDDNGRAVTDSIIRRNLYQMFFCFESHDEIISETKWKELGMITFIFDNVAVMPSHFVGKLQKAFKEKNCPAKESSVIKLRRKVGDTMRDACFMTLDVFLDARNIYQTENMKDRDCVCVILPRTIVMTHKNIISKFPPESEFRTLPHNFAFRLIGMPRNTITEHTGFCTIGEERVVDGGGDVPDYVLVRPFQYAASTSEGDCGSLFIIEDPRRKSKIFGMHVAGCQGTTTYGFSSPISRDCLQEIYISITSKEFTINDPLEPQAGFVIDTSLPSGLPQLYDVAEGVRHVTETTLMKSPLYGKWPMKQMSNTEMSHSAYIKAITKYDRDDISLDMVAISFIGKSLSGDLKNRSKIAVTKRLLTIEETIFGIDNDPDYGPISRISSPGFPFCLERAGIPGKQKWLGSLPEPSLTPAGNMFVKTVLTLEEEYIKGNRPEVVYVDNLKDEKTSEEKFNLGKTRLFSGVPFDYLLLVRRYFGAFTNWIFKNRVGNSIGVGVNPYKEWHGIAMHLRKFSKEDEKGFVAGDFSGFDCSGKRVVYNVILRLINDWYDDGSQNIGVRNILWLELTQSKHLHNNHVFQWHNSLPSGHPLTVIVNSLYNLIAFRYCWYRVNASDLACIPYFNKYVYLIVYGDDANASVHIHKRHIFNEYTIQQFMIELDLKYTSDTKQEFEYSLRLLKEITFLKRSYVKDPETDSYICPLDLEVILVTPGWTRRTDPIGITKTNVEWALRELSLWPDDVYEYYERIIENACFEELEWVPNVLDQSVNKYLILKSDAFYRP